MIRLRSLLLPSLIGTMVWLAPSAHAGAYHQLTGISPQADLYHQSLKRYATQGHPEIMALSEPPSIPSGIVSKFDGIRGDLPTIPDPPVPTQSSSGDIQLIPVPPPSEDFLDPELVWWIKYCNQMIETGGLVPITCQDIKW